MTGGLSKRRRPFSQATAAAPSPYKTAGSSALSYPPSARLISCVARARCPKNVNFAVKADYLKVLAMNSGVELSEDAKPGPDPIEHVKAYTVQIIAEM